MVVLLSVGEAMLDQSRDVSLIGGGEVTILPQGIDIDAMRTGGAGGMFFTIDRARFLTRQVLGGDRRADLVRTVSPGSSRGSWSTSARAARVRPTAVRAGGEIPSRAGCGRCRPGHTARHAGADSPRRLRLHRAHRRQQLYDELDRFHIPRRADSSWAEWQYYNIVTGPEEWWYVTYLVGGAVPDGRWGGRVMLTHRRPDGHYERFTSDAPSSSGHVRHQQRRSYDRSEPSSLSVMECMLSEPWPAARPARRRSI